MYVLGGRARDFVQVSNERMIGGLQDPIVEDIPRTLNNELQKFTT